MTVSELNNPEGAGMESQDETSTEGYMKYYEDYKNFVRKFAKWLYFQEQKKQLNPSELEGQRKVIELYAKHLLEVGKSLGKSKEEVRRDIDKEYYNLLNKEGSEREAVLNKVKSDADEEISKGIEKSQDLSLVPYKKWIEWTSLQQDKQLEPSETNVEEEKNEEILKDRTPDNEKEHNPAVQELREDKRETKEQDSSETTFSDVESKEPDKSKGIADSYTDEKPESKEQNLELSKANVEEETKQGQSNLKEIYEGSLKEFARQIFDYVDKYAPLETSEAKKLKEDIDDGVSLIWEKFGGKRLGKTKEDVYQDLKKEYDALEKRKESEKTADQDTKDLNEKTEKLTFSEEDYKKYTEDFAKDLRNWRLSGGVKKYFKSEKEKLNEKRKLWLEAGKALGKTDKQMMEDLQSAYVEGDKWAAWKFKWRKEIFLLSSIKTVVAGVVLVSSVFYSAGLALPAILGSAAAVRGISGAVTVEGIMANIKNWWLKKEHEKDELNEVADRFFEHENVSEKVSSIENMSEKLIERAERLNGYDNKKWFSAIAGGFIFAYLPKITEFFRSTYHKYFAGASSDSPTPKPTAAAKQSSTSFKLPKTPSGVSNTISTTIEETAKHGEGVWHLAERVLEKAYPGFDSLPYKDKIRIINDLKNYVIEHHKDCGIKSFMNNRHWIRLGQKVVFNLKDWQNSIQDPYTLEVLKSISKPEALGKFSKVASTASKHLLKVA